MDKIRFMRSSLPVSGIYTGVLVGWQGWMLVLSLLLEALNHTFDQFVFPAGCVEYHNPDEDERNA